MILADLLGSPEQLGAFGNMRIVVDESLAFDQSYIDTFHEELVVGELQHFIWRYQQALLNLACREACMAISKRLANTLGLH